MRKSVALAYCAAIAGLALVSAPEAYAQKSKKKKVAAAPPAAAKQWTDCSKVEPAKRDICIRSLPTVKGPVPLGGQAAAAAPAAAKADAPAKGAAKGAAPVAAAGSVASGVNPSSPCAKVEPAKRDACLSRAPATKGPGWAEFSNKAAPTKKK